MNVALTRAVLSGDTQIVKLLVSAGADVNAAPPPEPVLPLATAVVSNDAPMLDALTHLGADVNKRDNLGYTVLHYAAMTDYNDTTVIRKPIEAGASRDAKGPDGLTAVEMGQQKGYPHLAAALKTRG